MSGTKKGGQKTAVKVKRKYGFGFYSIIGQVGGRKKGIKKGFAANPQLAREAGKKGKRGPKGSAPIKRRNPWL